MRHFSLLSIVFNVFGTCEVRRMKRALQYMTGINILNQFEYIWN